MLRRFAPLFLLVVLLSGGVLPLHAQPLPPGTPSQVGFSAERLSRIQEVIHPYVDDNKLSGVVTAIARQGKLVHFEAYGQRDREAGLPMETNTLFRIYSMTKPIVSVAALMLYEQGHYRLTDPVSRYIPELEGLAVYDATAPGKQVPTHRPVTIRDLLTHTSGLTYGFFSNTPVDTLYRVAGILDNEGQTLADMAAKLGRLPLLHQPGTVWHYGVSTDVLGYLVEVVSGQTLAEYLHDEVFVPLGMHDTAFEVAEADLGRFAVNYALNEQGELVPADGGATSSFAAPLTFYSGGGGLVATPGDYLRFAQMLLNGGTLDGHRLLGPKTVELMTTNHLDGTFAPGVGFGLGVQVTTNLAATQTLGSEGSYGWSGMANTFFFVDPEEELIAMVWTQLLPFGYYPLREAFNIAVYQALID